MVRYLLSVSVYLILILACKTDNSRGQKVTPSNIVFRGACSGLEVSTEPCIVEAVEAGFEVQVKLYRHGAIWIRDLDLELLNSKGVPLNGWAKFHAAPADITMLNRTEEGYVSFRVTDPTFLANLFEDLLDDQSVNQRPISDTRKLARKLRKSGARRFVINAQCE